MANILRDLLFGILIITFFCGLCITHPSDSPLMTHRSISHPNLDHSKRADNSTPPACENVLVRREWRTIPREAKAAYINAIKCLIKKPSKLLGKGYRRFDDFQYVHCEMRKKIHFTSKFLVWHHTFIQTWETILRDECSYSGALHYWDWTQDAHDLTKSPLFSADSETGFGTNGANFSYDPSDLGGGIVQDGAFANFQILYPNNHLLERKFELPKIYVKEGYIWGSQYFDKDAMARIMSKEKYVEFSHALEGLDPAMSEDRYPGPHGIIHAVLGGDMPKLAYAANDVCVFYCSQIPDMLFYLIHCNVDRVWWQWISKNPEKRTMAFHGNKNSGSDKDDASLDDELTFMGLAPKIKVRDAMKWNQPPYCYRYA